MSIDEKMRRWNTDGQANSGDTNLEAMDASSCLGSDDEVPIPELSDARTFLTTHPTFTRLIFGLKAILEGKVWEGYRRIDIRHSILQHFAASPPPAANPPCVHFNVPAPSRSFLATDAVFKDGRSLSDVVMVAGGIDDAFATTSVEYVELVWGKDGVEILDKIQEAMDAEHLSSWTRLGESRISIEATNLELGGRVEEYLHVCVTGSPLSLQIWEKCWHGCHPLSINLKNPEPCSSGNLSCSSRLTAQCTR